VFKHLILGTLRKERSVKNERDVGDICKGESADLWQICLRLDACYYTNLSKNVLLNQVKDI
jgi:hypothetical protein